MPCRIVFNSSVDLGGGRRVITFPLSQKARQESKVSWRATTGMRTSAGGIRSRCPVEVRIGDYWTGYFQ
jgi:hypothetical protein